MALLAAWAAHDAEEWFTIGPWARTRGIPVSDGRARSAIVVMGVAVAVASFDGARTGGRSSLFQSALLAFGLHGFGHLALSVGVRGYSPGVVTAPLVVVPFWRWAVHRLGRAGVLRPARGLVPRAAALFAGSMTLSYGVAALVSRRPGVRVVGAVQWPDRR